MRRERATHRKGLWLLPQLTRRLVVHAPSFGRIMPGCFAIALSLVAIAHPLNAQPRSPVGRTSSDPSLLRADTLAARLDTAQAIAVLEAALKVQETNAALWHRYGQFQWRRAARARRGGYISDPKVIVALRLADSALRLATQFAPDSAEFWVTLGQFNLQSDVGSMRFAAVQQMAKAQSAASRVADSGWLAVAADEVGLAAWRRFEATGNRAQSISGQRVQLQTSGRWQRARAKDYLATIAKRIEPPTGSADFDAALSQFRVAVAAAPSQLRYSRHIFMAYAAKNRWDELLSAATKRGVTSAFDHQARFARGVALLRLGRVPEARAAFDSATALIDDDERARLFRLDRLLPPAVNVVTGVRGMDAATYRQLSAIERATTAAMYWALNDPKSVTVENEAELEFMARVTIADWIWTDDELGIRGTDTDRGDIFIRYGPPDEQLSIEGTASVQQDLSASGEVSSTAWSKQNPSGPPGGMSASSQLGGVTLAWIYTSGDVFFFDLAPGFGTARTPLSDQQFVHDLASIKPAAWGNVDAPVRIDSLSLRVTRFRAKNDSADVVLVTQVPARQLTHAVKARGGTMSDAAILVDLRLVDGAAHVFGRDSSRASASEGPTGTIRMSWVRRLGRGTSIVRLDALSPSAKQSANALRAISIEGAAGFGTSDILLTRVDDVAPPMQVARWSELGLTPSTGEFEKGEKIGVAWETYGLSSKDDVNRYRITIEVERVNKAGAAALAIRLLDGLGALITQSTGNAQRLSIGFTREVSARDTRVEYLTLDGLGTSAGDYRLKLTIVDLITNAVASRQTRFRVM